MALHEACGHGGVILLASGKMSRTLHWRVRKEGLPEQRAAPPGQLQHMLPRCQSVPRYVSHVQKGLSFISCSKTEQRKLKGFWGCLTLVYTKTGRNGL